MGSTKTSLGHLIQAVAAIERGLALGGVTPGEMDGALKEFLATEAGRDRLEKAATAFVKECIWRKYPVSIFDTLGKYVGKPYQEKPSPGEEIREDISELIRINIKKCPHCKRDFHNSGNCPNRKEGPSLSFEKTTFSCKWCHGIKTHMKHCHKI